MHKSHVIGCGAAIAAVAAVAVFGGSAGSLGVLVAALVCPLMMTGVLWMMMGGGRRAHRDDAVDAAAAYGASDTAAGAPR